MSSNLDLFDKKKSTPHKINHWNEFFTLQLATFNQWYMFLSTITYMRDLILHADLLWLIMHRNKVFLWLSFLFAPKNMCAKLKNCITKYSDRPNWALYNTSFISLATHPVETII